MIRKIGIVSLSSGIIGEDSVRHEVEIGLARLRDYGLEVEFLPHARMGLKYLDAHPEARAADLVRAFDDPDIDLILCAIGGDDTYRLLPYLMDGGALARAVRPKPFLGFSDTTINHFALHRLGLNTFYGQSFLADVCELGPQMLPYTRRYFEALLHDGTIRRITPSDTWYESRTHFGPDQVGKPLAAHPDRGFERLQGPDAFSGRILGGCIDSMLDMFEGLDHPDMPDVCRRYALFPGADSWRGQILLLESSEVQMPPALYRRSLEHLKRAGVFGAVSGVLVGKPMDEKFDAEYRRALVEVIDDPALPVVCNLNVGHALPRCIVPFGVPAAVDAARQVIAFQPDGAT